MPKLIHLLGDSTQVWTTVTLRRWYQRNDRRVEVLTGTGVWYHSGKPVVPLRWVLVRDPEGKFDPQGFLSTDLELTPAEILGYYVERWQVEVTFEESRQYLGVETQRQWSDTAIERTTPALFAVYSIVALIATTLSACDAPTPRRASWYVKEHIAFSDALAAVRRALWHVEGFSMSSSDPDSAKSSPAVLQRLIETLCYGS